MRLRVRELAWLAPTNLAYDLRDDERRSLVLSPVLWTVLPL